MAADLTAVVVALDREAAPFRRARRMRRLRCAAACPVWDDGAGTLLLVTGMGATAIRRALAWLLDPATGLRPTHVVSAGFCGGLVPDLAVGAVLQPDTVIGPSGETLPVPVERCVARTGGIVSVDEAVLGTAERAALHTRTGALAVDMESYAIVTTCQDAGVPCACLRVVSDDLFHPLPAEMARIIHDGRVRPMALATAVLRRPRLGTELVDLAGRTRRAAGVLADGLAALLGEPAPPRSAV